MMNHKIFLFVLLSCLSFSMFTAELSIEPGLIIILSGTSSAGKSSIIKDLQKIYKHEFKVLSIDNFMRSHPDIETWNNASGDEEDKIYEQISIDFYRYIKELSNNGNKILIDTVQFEKTEWMRCNTILESENVIQILDYCALPVLISHVKKRNKSGEALEKRSIFQAFEQFLGLYKLQESCDDQVVDRMHSYRIKQALQCVDKERRQFDIEYPESIEMRAKKWQAFSQKFTEQFKLNEMKKINIACKYQYDFIVDTGIDTPQVAARKIADYLESKV